MQFSETVWTLLSGWRAAQRSHLHDGVRYKAFARRLPLTVLRSFEWAFGVTMVIRFVLRVESVKQNLGTAEEINDEVFELYHCLPARILGGRIVL